MAQSTKSEPAKKNAAARTGAAVERARTSVEDAGELGREYYEQALERAEQAYEQALEKAYGAFEQALEPLADRSARTSEQMRKQADAAQSYARDNPMLIGVAGIATGLLLGAVLMSARR